MLATVLACLLVIVPHGDDETTVLDVIQATSDVTVAVMTDGAATSKCGRVSGDCEDARHASTSGFLTDTAPHARLDWYGLPDGALDTRRVDLIITNMNERRCQVLAAAADYGHRDHTAVRDAVRRSGGSLYDDSLRYDPETTDAVLDWYGWLGPWKGRWHHLGLDIHGPRE